MWRRGSVVASWLLDLAGGRAGASRRARGRSPAGCPTRARAAGRCRRRSRRGVPAACASARRCSRASAPQGRASSPTSLLSAMRHQFGGHQEKPVADGTATAARGGPRQRHVRRGFPEDHVIVLFGATGDLARRKLLPGMFHLFETGRMPPHFRVDRDLPARADRRRVQASWHGRRRASSGTPLSPAASGRRSSARCPTCGWTTETSSRDPSRPPRREMPRHARAGCTTWPCRRAHSTRSSR